jgi:hypothetical protein
MMASNFIRKCARNFNCKIITSTNIPHNYYKLIKEINNRTFKEDIVSEEVNKRFLKWLDGTLHNKNI